MIQLSRISTLFILISLLAACQYGPVTGPRGFDPAAEPTLVPTSEAVARPTYTIQQGRVTQVLSFEGRVSPRFETAVLAPQVGTILELDVQVGDYIVEGDRIARFDISALEAKIENTQEEIAEQQAILEDAAQAQATGRQEAEIELEIAQLELAIAQDLAETDTSEDTLQMIDLLTLKVDLAHNRLDQLSAQIDPDGVIAAVIAELEAELAELESQRGGQGIYATADGVILGLGTAAGNTVSTDQEVAIIGDLGSVEDLSVSAVLRSDNLERLSDGMSVTLSFDSRPDETFSGSIVRLPYPYNVGGNNLGFDSEDLAVRILPDDTRLLDQFNPGTAVTVSLILAENDEALWLPDEAIREFSGRSFIVVRDGNREQRVDVERGLTGGDRVEIIGRIEAGQEVIGP